jgi:hypothetical protein
MQIPIRVRDVIEEDTIIDLPPVDCQGAGAVSMTLIFHSSQGVSPSVTATLFTGDDIQSMETTGVSVTLTAQNSGFDGVAISQGDFFGRYFQVRLTGGGTGVHIVYSVYLNTYEGA